MLGRRGLRLGKIHGVEVFLDPSWFIFGVLISWLLGSEFSSSYPSLHGGGAYALGAMGAVLFLVSVLAHELSHSVVAQRKGIPVPRITLYIFGGVAQISSEPHKPGDEAKIALAGPAMSLGLCGLFAGLGIAAEAVGAIAPQALFFTLAVVNGLLAVFNMLPGFPLDGGRVFRAIVWRITGDFTKATKVAAGSGRIIGLAMIAFGGVLAIFGGDPINGIWLALIGMFLHSLATASYRQAGAQPHGLPQAAVADLMTRQPPWVSSSAALDDSFAQWLAASRDRAFPVVGPDGLIAGVVTAETLESVPRDRWPGLHAGNIMVPMQATMATNPLEPFASVIARLAMNPVGRFVVLDGGRLVGMLTPAALGQGPLGPGVPAQPSPARQGR